ncbi:MAG: transcription-repair coupling factor, partial [Gammaproteobacteria bacterium]|nr:transcription-repair coupling factor [Gammaproteobacteria bacterium]
GIEYYLPFFFENTASLFDYLPKNSTVIGINDIKKNEQDFWHEINVRYEQLRHDQIRPILSPEEIFFNPEQISEIKDNFQQVLINNKEKAKDYKDDITTCFKTKNIMHSFSSEDAKNKISDLKRVLKAFLKANVLFIAETVGRREALIKILSEINIRPVPVESWQEFIQTKEKVAITVAKIERPLHVVFEDGNELLIITDTQVLGEKVIKQKQNTATRKKIDAIISNLTELQVGDPIVHIDYGVGRYLGLQKLPVNDYEAEFLLLEYASETKLYVPVTSLSLISRYTGGVEASEAPLNHLGSKQWEKVKSNAAKQIRDTAAELLEIYARRLKARGFSFTKPGPEYERFVAAFPFTTTDDQDRAITEVISDMTSNRPMDRLICGDVGFGKTEVAMRAAFLASYSGKQAAILTPTTLLAQQHFTNFQDRFAAWPLKISLFSRFSNSKEIKRTLEDLSIGKIDIIIGTHKLLQKTVQFKNLGLLVIDEEHRFGVRQKEHIKQLAAGIDILALTATPIPRTLNMAFADIRDFSIISTPPAKRLAIKTFIREYDAYLIKEAILRETMRGGQVYFLHNNITSIEKIARDLKQLIPSIRIAVAHGQMRKQELEQIMRDFYHLHVNVLVCTTIIESGLDLPSANTIIINRADKFGLAQLHQLRGRVGRSHHQAYAYLIIPPKSILTSDAKKRLDAIELMKDLGTGFMLATNDLEIRGAGELLGEKQSGVIQGVGFTLYMDMLKRAVKTLKKGKNIDEHESSIIKPELELQLSALIPDKYIDSVNLRLILYKKIAEAKDQDELDGLQIEMIDRFGLLPEQTKNLFIISALKIKAQNLGIIKMTLGINKGTIEFAPGYNVDLKTLISILQKYTRSFKFAGAQTVEFVSDLKVSKLDFVDNLLNEWLKSTEK